MKKTIIGIDPGLATTGFAVIQQQGDQFSIIDFGVLTTDPSLPLPERLARIDQDFKILLKRYQPDELCIEQVFFSKNTKTALLVSQAKGVILASAASAKIPVRSLTPNEVKLAVTGDGKADKLQVQDMIQKHFSLKELPKPDDAADALAIAYTGSMF